MLVGLQKDTLLMRISTMDMTCSGRGYGGQLNGAAVTSVGHLKYSNNIIFAD